MTKVLWTLPTALAISIATAWFNPRTDERALYGSEGPIERNWLPRPVAGWPAPFLADDPGTSVMHEVGIEDTFRAGPFTATLSFWAVVVWKLRGLPRGLARARHRWLSNREDRSSRASRREEG